MDPTHREKYQKLKKSLEEMGSALLAYSGGVDSTLLLSVGREALGDDIIAVTISSPLHPRSQQEAATLMAARLRANHIIVETNELEIPDFASNPPERCYLCKRERRAGFQPPQGLA